MGNDSDWPYDTYIEVKGKTKKLLVCNCGCHDFYIHFNIGGTVQLICTDCQEIYEYKCDGMRV